MNRIFLIIASILAVVVIGSVLLSLFFGPKQAPKPIEPVIKSNFTPSPQGINNSSKTQNSIEVLKLIGVNPNEDTTQTYFPVKQITFTFNQPVELSSVKVQSSPSVNTVVTSTPDNLNAIVISPQPAWEPGITTITISAGSSISGSLLEKPITYKINTQYPENPPQEVPEH